ncbi:MAG: hypothetical protein KDD84_18075 [Caldilineaceae bacterium]|nr:hypothetical protein [Caldilineaceae bacterium]
MKTQQILTIPPALSRFDPLPKILFFDDFDHGLQGWTGLIGNYEGSLNSMLPPYRDLRVPQLSNLTQWDTGSDGSLNGTYAMKLATRAKEGSFAVGIKRATFRHAGPVRLEAYFTFKPEASELKLSETDVRAVGVLFDLQDGDSKPNPYRVMPHLRYVNALNGEAVGKWQFKARREELLDIGGSGKTKSHFHLAAEGWEDLPGGEQKLCYNEIATKQNWYYLRLDFDLAEMSFLRFQCNDRVFDLDGVQPMRIPAMANLWCMLNTVFFVETDRDKRAFLYLDSIVLSQSQPE